MNEPKYPAVVAYIQNDAGLLLSVTRKGTGEDAAPGGKCGATPPAQKHPKYERSWLSKQTDDKLADLYVDHVGFFDMNGMMLERENMIETLAAIIGDP